MEEGAGRMAIVLAEEMLSEAHGLVLSGWCQGARARDEYGRDVEPSSAFARQWSAPGAVERVWRRSSADPELTLLAFEHASLALTAAVKGVPQEWNDTDGRHQSEVLDALAEAVLILSAEDTERPLRHPPVGDVGRPSAS